MATAEVALARLCDPEAEVSAHYLIDSQGTVFRLVDEDKRAWHAGAGAWGGRDDVNSRSIGIELANDGATPFTARQMDALEPLLADILARHGIGPEGVIAHSDMAPQRKCDPGARFDWRRLALAGLSVWPEGRETSTTDGFLRSARAFGYPDADAAAVLSAFRLRFRPWAEGAEDETDAALIADLAARYSVDRGAGNA